MELLDFQEKLETKTVDGKSFIFCIIRKKWLVLQPEEIVRQLYLHFLTNSLGYSQHKISVERGLKINGIMRRFDILVYDGSISPLILVECKSMFVDINQSTMQQVGQYNLPLKAQYLVLTNGRKTVNCELNNDKTSYEFINRLPKNEKK